MPLDPKLPPTISQPPARVGQTRIIEDKGIYVLTDEELSAWRLRILVDVIVLPPIAYKSFKPNEPEQYFGVFEIVEGGFLQYQSNLKYVHQQVFRYQNDAAKALFDAYCASVFLTISVYNSDVAILNSIPNSSGIAYIDPPRLKHLVTPCDQIWFKTVPGCKIAVHTEFLPLPQIGGFPASIPEPAQADSPSAPAGAGGDGSPPSDAPPTAPATPPYSPSNQDNGRTTPHGSPPLPGGGFWYFTSQFFETRNDCQPQTGTAVVDGADDPNVRPYFVQTGVNGGCSMSVDGHIVSNGGQRQILGSSGQFSFEYR